MINEMTNATTSIDITDNIISIIKAERSTSTRRESHAIKGYKTRTAADGSTVYESQIGLGSRKIYLGSFSTPEEATAAYTTAKARIAELRQQPQ